jgi:uncharacterized protein YnzC (UPF0291/DUF896 family)
MLEQIFNIAKKMAGISFLAASLSFVPCISGSESQKTVIKQETEKGQGHQTLEEFCKMLTPLSKEKILFEIKGTEQFKQAYLKKFDGSSMQSIIPYQNTYHFINIHLNREYQQSIVEEVFEQFEKAPEEFLNVYKDPLKGSISKLSIIDPQTTKNGTPLGWMVDLGIKTIEIKDANGSPSEKKYRLKKFIDLKGKPMSPWYLGVDVWGTVIIRYSGPTSHDTATLELPEYSYLNDREKQFLDILKKGKIDITKIKRGYNLNENLDLITQIGWEVEIDKAADTVRNVRLDSEGKLIYIEDSILPTFITILPYFHGYMPK